MGVPGRDSVLHPSDEWETPRELWSHLNRYYRFDLDLAASAENHKTEMYYSKHMPAIQNGMLLADPEKVKVSWCNPPFSIADVFFRAIGASSVPVVAIYKANNLETAAWKEIWKKADWLVMLSSRVQYELKGVPGSGCSFGSALIGFNLPVPPMESELYHIHGTLITDWRKV
jgi:phage N-6-adenine-methyltransferase